MDKSLINTLACPKCKNPLLMANNIPSCQTCSIAFDKVAGTTVISFLCPQIYSSTQEYDWMMRTVEYWDMGWEKRLTDEDHIFFFKMSRQELVDYVKQATDTMNNEGDTGGLLANDVHYSELKEKVCLNIGCGAGTEALILTVRGGAKCIAIDLTPSAVHAGHTILEKLGGDGFGIQADVRYLPFKDNSIDAVYSSGVLHHSPNIQQSISEILRVLKPGGVAYVALYSSWNFHFMSLKIKAWLSGRISPKRRQRYFSEMTECDWRTGSRKNVLTTTYTIGQCKRLFRQFGRVSVRGGRQTLEQLPVIGRYIGVKHKTVRVPLFPKGNYITAYKS